MDNPFPPRPEFSVQPITRPEALFRHSGWAPDRDLVWQALQASHVSAGRLDRFCQCGSGARAVYSPSLDRYTVQANYCHDRFCRPCGTARAAIIAGNLAKRLTPKRTRFVTLTMRHSQTPLKDQINRIYDSLRKLGRRQWWQREVAGAVWFLEVKLSDTDHLWHVHLHGLVECKTGFLDSRTLSTEWHAITGDSSIVQVQALRTSADCISYASKYAGKALDRNTMLDRDAFLEAIAALRGRRLCLTTGSLRGLQLEKRADDPKDWQLIGSIDALIVQAADGDDYAKWILATLRTGGRPAPTEAPS